MIRARISDLEVHYAPLIGVRVHRSWWVRVDALERVRTTGRNCYAITRDGKEIPVSRARRGALEAALDLAQSLDKQ